MATAAEAQALLDGSMCYQCYLPGDLAWYGVIAALIDIANGNPVPTAAQLATEASCIQCVIPQGLIASALIASLSNAGIGGGSGVGNLTGAADPNGTVSGDLGQIYTQVVGSAVTIWVNTDGGTTWV